MNWATGAREALDARAKACGERLCPGTHDGSYRDASRVASKSSKFWLDGNDEPSEGLSNLIRRVMQRFVVMSTGEMIASGATADIDGDEHRAALAF